MRSPGRAYNQDLNGRLEICEMEGENGKVPNNLSTAIIDSSRQTTTVAVMLISEQSAKLLEVVMADDSGWMMEKRAGRGESPGAKLYPRLGA
jgi:hypothetical protein